MLRTKNETCDIDLFVYVFTMNSHPKVSKPMCMCEQCSLELKHWIIAYSVPTIFINRLVCIVICQDVI